VEKCSKRSWTIERASEREREIILNSVAVVATHVPILHPSALHTTLPDVSHLNKSGSIIAHELLNEINFFKVLHHNAINTTITTHFRKAVQRATGISYFVCQQLNGIWRGGNKKGMTSCFAYVPSNCMQREKIH
jgi:hypothetical protein